MTHSPRSTEEIYESIRDSLTGSITKLTNFTDRSFNYLWTQAFSQQVRELEVQTTVAELAGWVNFSGKEIDENDLERLGVSDNLSPSEVNEYMDDQYLDNLVEIVGVERNEGIKATGTVTFNTQSSLTEIPEGTVVTTQPDSSGNTIDFETTQTVETIDGQTQVTDVPIKAVESGPDSNVPADTIVRVAYPPIGVQGVNNPESTTGGTDRETNEELRKRSKQALQSAGLGGTTQGIEGYIQQEIEAVREGDVEIEEFTDQSPVFVDVIVDGGIDSNVKEAIEFSRPTGIRHNLVRPEIIQLGFNIDVRGSGIDTDFVRESVEDKLLSLGIGDNFYEDELIRSVMESDDGIINIDNLGGLIERVTGEEFTFSDSQSEYRLDYTYESTNGSITIEDDSESGGSYVEGTDFTVNDQSGDGHPETIVWTGVTPNDGQKFFVSYDVTVPGQTPESDFYDSDLVRDEAFTFQENVSESFTYEAGNEQYFLENVPFDNSTSITDSNSNTFTEGTDYDIVDNTGNGFAQTVDWTIGGSTPADNADFTITYNKKVYQTEYEHRDTPLGIIRDFSGDTYNQDTEYTTIDYKPEDDEKDAIEWLTNPSTLNDDEEFFFTYLTEGDVFLSNREKADPGTITINQTN
jgi:Uncharacterized homolog of phage Mu protein gp47